MRLYVCACVCVSGCVRAVVHVYEFVQGACVCAWVLARMHAFAGVGECACFRVCVCVCVRVCLLNRDMCQW